MKRKSFVQVRYKKQEKQNGELFAIASLNDREALM